MLKTRHKDSTRPRKPNRYLSGDGDTEPIRRPLRVATRTDRILIYLFVFLAGAALTAGSYLYLATNTHFNSLPLAIKTGADSRQHFWGVSLIGGLLAMGCYAVISMVDPYGHHAAEKAEKAEKQKRALLMEEIRKNQVRRK